MDNTIDYNIKSEEVQVAINLSSRYNFAMKRGFLLFLGFVLFSFLLLNFLQEHQRSSTPWPVPVAADHSQIAANLDLTELATLDDTALRERWEQLRQDGVTILRVRIPWDMIQPAPEVWDWEALDRILMPKDNNVSYRYILVLDGSPEWARAAVDADNPYAPPKDVRDFGQFAQEVSLHVRHTFHPFSTNGWLVAYQIWHEPNIGPHWGARYSDPQGYFELLREASNRIRGADPDAQIMLAALAPTTTADGFNIPDPVYLDRLLRLGAGEFFEFAAGQAYGFDQPPEAAPGPDRLNFRRVELLHDVLVRNGVGERVIYITSWGWWTPQSSELRPEVSPWRSIPVDDLFDYQQRGMARLRYHWPWAAAPAWVQYAPSPKDDLLRLGWVQRNGAGEPTQAGNGLRLLAHVSTYPGAGTYSPEIIARATLISNQGWRWGHDAADPMGPGAEFKQYVRGRAIALNVQRGPYKGYFEVWIDGKPAPELPRDPATGNAYLILYDPANSIETIPLARNLPYGDHLLRIRAQGGWGRWPLRSIIIDDRSHPKPWPFWPITAALVIAVMLVIWSLLSERNSVPGAQRSIRRLPSVVSLIYHLLDSSAAILPVMALVALPFYMRPLRFGPVGFSLHELLIWLGVCAAVGSLVLSSVERLLFADDRRFSIFISRPVSHHNIIDVSIFLLLISGLFAALDAQYRGYAFYDWRVTFLTPVMFYILITRFTLRRDGGIQLLGHGALLGGGLIGMVALWQAVTGQAVMVEGVMRVQGFYGSANNLALMLGRLLPLVVVLVFGAMPSAVGYRKIWRCGYGIAFLVMVMAGFLTFSKGLMFISIPVSMVVLFAYQKSLRKSLLVLVGVGAAVLIPFLNTPRLSQIISGTGRFRLFLWQSAWRMWLDHPWLGVGPDNFLYAYRSRYVLPSAWEELNLSHPHNLFFDLLTRVGLFGFIAGLLLLGILLWQGQVLLRRLKPGQPQRLWLLGLWAGWLAGMAHGLIDNSLFLPDLMILTLLVAGVVRGMGDRLHGQ